MNKLQYNMHLLLTSKYRLFINLFIILLIYSILYDNKVIYCMNDNTNSVDLPRIAEAKEPVRPSEQVIALRRNIQAYAGYLVSHLESRDQIIEESKHEILQLTQQIEQQQTEIGVLRARVHNLTNELNVHTNELNIKKTEIKKLTDSIEGCRTNYGLSTPGYKNQIDKLRNEVADLRRDLHISETLLAETKHDKKFLFDMLGKVIDREK